MLGLKPGHTVSVDELAEGLWGERPPASAAKMIQLYVSHLRRAIEGDGAAIVRHGRGYALELAAADVDAVRFEALVEEGKAGDALALWHDDPLSDVRDEPFAAAEIRRLDDLRVRALETAIDSELATGRHREVLARIDELVAEHPLRERLHAQRMLALYRAGRQADALGAYRDARTTLVEEIGVEPGPDLRRLHEAISPRIRRWSSGPPIRRPRAALRLRTIAGGYRSWPWSRARCSRPGSWRSGSAASPVATSRCGSTRTPSPCSTPRAARSAGSSPSAARRARSRSGPERHGSQASSTRRSHASTATPTRS